VDLLIKSCGKLDYVDVVTVYGSSQLDDVLDDTRSCSYYLKWVIHC